MDSTADRVRLRYGGHSATKYLNGHSDLVGGVAVVGDNKELADQIGFLQNSVGAIAGAFDSFLVLRSLKTLALTHGTTLCECAGDRALAGRTTAGQNRPLPWIEIASAA